MDRNPLVDAERGYGTPSSSSPPPPSINGRTSEKAQYVDDRKWYDNRVVQLLLVALLLALFFGLGLVGGIFIQRSINDSNNNGGDDFPTQAPNATTAIPTTTATSPTPTSPTTTATVAPTPEPNPPVWPSNVFIFDPATPGVTQSVVDRVFAEVGGTSPPDNGQFSSSRYAFLFRPGNHPVNVNIGYYTTLHGLGSDPTETLIESVQAENGDTNYQVGALNNFWRGAENFQTTPTKTWNNVPNSMLWAVSQAAPLRNVVINGNLQMYQYNSGCCAGYASGGYLANARITGTVYSGSQQQWISRNAGVLTAWNGGVWNMVFVGSNGNLPAQHCSNVGGNPYTSAPTTPVIAEKPQLYYNSDGKFSLVVPSVKYNSVGPDFTTSSANIIDFNSVYVATPNDTAQFLSAKIAIGHHVVFTPGIYVLKSSIVVSKPGMVLLGIGIATLQCEGAPCIVVNDGVDDVRIGGILLQAGTTTSSTLLQWGTTKSSKLKLKPSFMYDVYARVGGPTDSTRVSVSTDVMVTINSANVVIDNSWLWRADHDVGGIVYSRNNPVNNTLVVNGDGVTAYGLAGEHSLQDLVVWNGENGATYFFQSEFPYDVDTEYSTGGFVAYRVNSTVSNHVALGVGAYSNFRDHTVVVKSAFVSGPSAGVKFQAPLTVFLNGNGGINSIVNGQGKPVVAGCTSPGNPCQAYLC
eukprot:TRINITY_DN5453_c0_g1_i1.p1 TRINITY_DN5453_c0_g1~~TRINITY_DN5453_c0_g1_i1.p1  ORF type:complete len:692 (+),score=171.65 TRINITY_DN5453_c0_g1_i1:193-2268(+)